MNRKHFLALVAGGLAASLAPLPALAQGKAIEWVVGYAAGGGSDVVARIVAESMGKTLNRPIVITNKPGAGTNIAADYAARSRDHGNVLFTADFATLAANPALFSKLTYNAEKDFQPVGLLVRFPLLLVVSNNVPAGNLKEFTAWTQSQKDGVSWASAGLGSPHHLAGELFREKTGLKLTHVPYRGAAPALQEVVGGQLPAMWVDSATAAQFVTGKKVKVIGVASASRMATLPEVPTMAEQGLKGFEAYAWQGLVVPTGTAPEAIDAFSRALQSALASPAVLSRLQALGVEPMPGTPAQMAAFTRSERERWTALIAKLGVRLD